MSNIDRLVERLIVDEAYDDYSLEECIESLDIASQISDRLISKNEPYRYVNVAMADIIVLARLIAIKYEEAVE